MVRESYKEVKLIGQSVKIPEEWPIKELDKYIKVLSGYSFSSDQFNNEEKGLPLIRIRDLQESKIETYYNGEYDKKYIIDNGDILIGMDGNFYVVKWKNDSALLNQRVCKVDAVDDILDQNYLYYRIEPEIEKIHRITPATTVKHLSIKDIKRIRIPVPSILEQKKIADILSSVDEAIAKTEEIINQNKELKKGLMQELLTKGIGHSEFKEVRLGVKKLEIPVEWEIKEIGKLATIKRGASPRPISDPKWFDENSNVGWVRISDISRTGKYLFETEQYLSEKGIAKSRLANTGDLILSICATLGKPSILKINACIHDGLVGFFDIKDNIDTEYLYYFLLKIRPNFEAKRQTGTQANLNSTLVRRTQVLVPPLEEQKKIASILSSLDAKIEKEEEYKAELEQLKKGLMQKLLTGEVRVKVNN
jgi:type I restriction enzyme S subunit